MLVKLQNIWTCKQNIEEIINNNSNNALFILVEVKAMRLSLLRNHEKQRYKKHKCADIRKIINTRV